MLDVHPLTPDEIRTAYPLMRAAVPTLRFREWARFARRAAASAQGDRAGIMVACLGERGVPAGLYVWHVVRELGLGRVLVAEKVVAFDLAGRHRVAKALVASIEALGARLGCETVKTVLCGDRTDMAPWLMDAGHRQDAAILAKRPAAG